MNSSLKQNIVAGIIWQSLERCGSQLIQFIVSIILARLLEPRDFGLIAIVLVFLTISDIFVDGGFRNSIIQAKEITAQALSSIFWCNIAVAFLAYCILWAIAPYIADVYHHEELKRILRFLGIIPIIHGISVVNNSLLIKNMAFRKKLLITLSALSISAPVGISMAFFGHGVWSLVTMRIAEATVTTIVTITVVRWLPKFTFSLKSVSKLFSFGGKLLCISMLDQFFLNFFQLFVGKFFDISMLAFYNRGNSYAKLAMNTVNNSISPVMFPAFSRIQNDRAELKNLLCKSIKILMVIVIPLLAMLALCAHPLVIILLTAKWERCVFFLQMGCVEYSVWPLQILNIWCILSRGDSSSVLRMEIAKKVLLTLAVLLSIRYDLKIMIIAWTSVTIVNFFLNSYPNARQLKYGGLHQLVDLMPTLLVTAASLVLALPFCYVKCGPTLQLPLRIAVFGTVYVLLSMRFQRSTCDMLIRNIKSKIHRI